ncbi:acetyl-CoA carboxylase biotin carboxyl carrier protein [Actinokineospora soli]|uniref:Biotin carboxyl carrier protein of acetyl-CoA carboxylase n=1 Tax=Actinokineospora soli TaxID=1048753 RepID=A0ABW2TV37_9PSEU
MSPLDAAQLSEVPRLTKPAPQSADVTAALAGAGQLAEILKRTGAARIAVSVGDIQWEVEAAVATTTVVAAAAPAPAAAPEAVAEAAPLGHDLTAPLVGVFYRAPGPGKAPYVEVGDKVETGQQVAIVEAMKMLNEVVADRPGVIGAVYPVDGDVVEFGQPLFRIDPA